LSVKRTRKANRLRNQEVGSQFSTVESVASNAYSVTLHMILGGRLHASIGPVDTFFITNLTLYLI